ncbi:hypothetical protein [Pseudomonas sp. NPDC096950]|uniref:hypothetical protein n=1 Tax=Pseudomonas sp. NPDC096950 TaxID=3364485 RepID=UPI00383AF6FB
MSMSVAVDTVEKGDRVELWIGEAPQVWVIDGITEGGATRTFHVRVSNQTMELFVQRGQTVTLMA